MRSDGWYDTTVAFDRRIRATTSGGPSSEIVNAGGCRLTPGLIDLHAHGIGRFAFERSPDDLRNGLRLLPSFGVTTVLPTLYRVLGPDTLAQVQRLAAVLEESLGVRVPGFHFEGPFLAIAGAGALTLKGDIAFLDELLAAAGGRVAAMSISPEVPGILPVIERLRERDIVVFITHTRASVEQTQAAIDAGARHATHFYDVFPLPPETEPGVRPVGAVETILADPRVTVDFICDGVHVHPAAIRAAHAAKGDGGVIAITDANIGAGMPAGEYETPWGFAVRVCDGNAARVVAPGQPNHGTIAGSSLTMNQIPTNLERWGLPARTAWQMATANPARCLGLNDRGAIEPGLSADLVLWDDDHRPIRTWVEGVCVFAQSDMSGERYGV